MYFINTSSANGCHRAALSVSAFAVHACTQRLRTLILGESFRKGFHGLLAGLSSAAMRSFVNVADMQSSESCDRTVTPRGKDNKRGQWLTSKTWSQNLFHGRSVARPGHTDVDLSVSRQLFKDGSLEGSFLIPL